MSKATISDAVKYIGADDTDLDLFEGQYIIPNGISYNSYVILDDKIAVLDTVDARKTDEWLANLEATLCGKTPDYLIINHMEPDHAANVNLLMDKYPTLTGVCNQKAADMMNRFFGTDYSGRLMIVKERDTLALGSHPAILHGAYGSLARSDGNI